MGELPIVDLLVRLLLQEFNKVLLAAHATDLCSKFHAIPQMNRQLAGKAESMLICYRMVNTENIRRGIFHEIDRWERVGRCCFR